MQKDDGLLAAAMVLRAAERVADRLRAIPPGMRHESETELVEAVDRMRRAERDEVAGGVGVEVRSA